jgi:hypothetical protein
MVRLGEPDNARLIPEPRKVRDDLVAARWWLRLAIKEQPTCDQWTLKVSVEAAIDDLDRCRRRLEKMSQLQKGPENG